MAGDERPNPRHHREQLRSLRAIGTRIKIPSIQTLGGDMHFLDDVRYAMRQFAHAPGFTGTAVLTLALGIGATTAIFTLVHAVLLKSLPVTRPSEPSRAGDLRNAACSGGGRKN